MRRTTSKTCCNGRKRRTVGKDSRMKHSGLVRRKHTQTGHLHPPTPFPGHAHPPLPPHRPCTDLIERALDAATWIGSCKAQGPTQSPKAVVRSVAGPVHQFCSRLFPHSCVEATKRMQFRFISVTNKCYYFALVPVSSTEGPKVIFID